MFSYGVSSQDSTLNQPGIYTYDGTFSQRSRTPYRFEQREGEKDDIIYRGHYNVNGGSEVRIANYAPSAYWRGHRAFCIQRSQSVGTAG